MRNSWLLCPRDHKRLVIDQAEEEGQALVTHTCVSCGYTERAPGQRPQRTGSPYVTDWPDGRRHVSPSEWFGGDTIWDGAP